MSDQENFRPLSASPDYAHGQIHKLLITAASHSDPETRERAKNKIARWKQVVEGMATGSLTIGSRSPVKGLPNWMTMEVVTGGFATGALSAGGPLLDFERALLSRVAPEVAIENEGDPDRTALNLYYLSESGFDELLAMLETGKFTITVPEEGALMTVAWLSKRGAHEEARSLIDTLLPYFGQARFYPEAVEQPSAAASKVFLRSIKQVTVDVKAVTTSRKVLAQRERIDVWIPLYERAVRLLLSFWEGEPPTLDNQSSRTTVSGGQLQPELGSDFAKQAKRLVFDISRLRVANKLCKRPRRKDNLAQLVEILEAFLAEGEIDQSQRDRIRVLCARYVTKRGVPDSETHTALREAQLRQVAIPLFTDLAKILAQRLARENQKSGVEDVSRLVADVSEDETQKSVPAGMAIPKLFVEKVERCLLDSVESLIERKVIKSGDTLAIVLPQITANLRAIGIADPLLRALYCQIYKAFSTRRSLLLLNYESQTRIEELPWVQAIESYREKKQATKAIAYESLREIVFVQLTSFPQAIVPNKLLQEIGSLASVAEIELPVVNELAADIFMGSFTYKFLQASKIASSLLAGSVYTRYYSIDFDEIKRIPDAPKPQKKQQFVTIVCNEFAKICKRRASEFSGSATARYWSVAGNGTVIEQQQILTSQNVVVLLKQLDLVDRIKPLLMDMAQECFVWICRQLQIVDPKFHSRLIKVKNSAFAWRQMLVYVSLMKDSDQAAFLAWAKENLNAQRNKFQSQFAFAINGLESAIALTRGAKDRERIVPYLGWVLGDHPLLSKQ